MYIHVFLKIIGDRKRKSGNYEYGARFYTPAKKRGAYTHADEWWFIQNAEIKKTLDSPRIECVSANRSYFYFDDPNMGK